MSVKTFEVSFLDNEIIECTFDFKSSIGLLDLKLNLVAFLKDLGYSKIKINDFNIKSQRGSAFQNIFALNPLKWKNSIDINFEVVDDWIREYGEFKICTIHQFIIEKEILAWEQVLIDFENLVLTGKNNAINSVNIALKVKKETIRLVLWVISGAILGCIISVYLAISFDLPFLVPILVILGAILFFKIGMSLKK